MTDRRDHELANLLTTEEERKLNDIFGQAALNIDSEWVSELLGLVYSPQENLTRKQKLESAAHKCTHNPDLSRTVITYFSNRIS